MFKTMIIGNLGHNNKYFDRTCRNCGGLYDSVNGQICPKCGIQLVPITNTQGRAMAISEGTIYPAISKEMKEAHEKATASTPNGMFTVFRFALFSFAGKDGIVPEHPLHKYLITGRQIQIEINHPPIAKHFKNKAGDMCCELRFAVITSHPFNDKVQLLGQKTNELNNRVAQPAPQSQPTVADLNLQNELAVLKRRLAQLEAGKDTTAQSEQPTETVEEPMFSDTPVDISDDYEVVPEQCEFVDENGIPLL